MDEVIADRLPGDGEKGEYVKPRITWEESLEIRADLTLACGKSAPGQYLTCVPGNLSS